MVAVAEWCGWVQFLFAGRILTSGTQQPEQQESSEQHAAHPIGHYETLCSADYVQLLQCTDDETPAAEIDESIER